MLLAINQIPPVAHLEHVGTLVEAVPHVGHEHALVIPFLHVGRCPLCQHTLAALLGRHEHVIEVVVASEDEGVAEVVLLIAIVGATEIERAALCPCLEVGACCHHDHLAAVALVQLILMSCEEGVIELVALVVDGRSCADGCILLVYATARNQFSQRGVRGSVGGAHRPDGVIGTHGVGTIVLQIENLEVFGHRVVERHGVTHISALRLIVDVLCCKIRRGKEGGGRPVALLHNIVVVAATHQRCHGCSSHKE